MTSIKEFKKIILDNKSDKIIKTMWSNSYKKNINIRYLKYLLSDELLCMLPIELWYYILSFLNDDFLVCTTLKNKVYIIYNPCHTLSNIFEMDYKPFDDLILSNDSKLLLSYKNLETISSVPYRPICNINIFDIQTKQILINFNTHHYTYGIYISPNNRYFITRAENGLLILYNIDGSYMKTINTLLLLYNIVFLSEYEILVEHINHKFELNIVTDEIKNITENNSSKCRISPNNKIMLTCENNGEILIRNIHNDSIIKLYNRNFMHGLIYEYIAFSPNDKYIARFINFDCFVYDTLTGEIKYSIKMNDYITTFYNLSRTAAFSFNNNYIATSIINQIILWKLSD
jgi:WD40 repeat protein